MAYNKYRKGIVPNTSSRVRGKRKQNRKGL